MSKQQDHEEINCYYKWCLYVCISVCVFDADGLEWIYLKLSVVSHHVKIASVYIARHSTMKPLKPETKHTFHIIVDEEAAKYIQSEGPDRSKKWGSFGGRYKPHYCRILRKIIRGNQLCADREKM